MARKILFFNQGREIGGTDTFLINLVRFWPDKSDELSILCNPDHKGRGLYEPLGVKYDDASFPTLQVMSEKINGPKMPKLLNKILRIGLYLLKPLLFILATGSLYRKLKKDKYDVIFSSNGGYPAGELCQAIVIAAKLARIPKIYLIVHSAAGKPKFPFKIWEYFVLDRLVARACSEIITVSRSCAEQVEGARNIRRRLKVIPNGISLEKNDGFTLEAKRKALKLDPNCKVIGAIGDYEEGKGHIYLVQAFNQVKREFPDARLIIIGSSSYSHFDVLKELINDSKFKNDIFLPGYLPKAGDYIECFDLLAFPSVVFESFGICLLEAMLYKKPVIGTSIGGIPEVIGDAGYIVEPKNSDQLAEKIILLLKNAEKAKMLGERGYARLKSGFTAEMMAQKYYELSVDERKISEHEKN